MLSATVKRLKKWQWFRSLNIDWNNFGKDCLIKSNFVSFVLLSIICMSQSTSASLTLCHDISPLHHLLLGFPFDLKHWELDSRPSISIQVTLLQTCVCMIFIDWGRLCLNLLIFGKIERNRPLPLRTTIWHLELGQ